MNKTETANSNSSYLRDFAGIEIDQPPTGQEWTNTIRSAARARFAELGFPNRSHEEWRYTPIAPIVETPFKLANRATGSISPAQLAAFTFNAPEWVELVFVNGHYAPELSTLHNDSNGISVSSLASAIESDNTVAQQYLAKYAAFDLQHFVALNTAVLGDGAYVHIPRGVVVEQPIHLLFISNSTDDVATVSHPRSLIVAEENSQATIVESYVGIADQVYFTNAVTEVVLGPNAVVDHYKVQRESAKAFHVATTQMQLDRASNFRSHSINIGGSLVRNDINAVLGAEGIECTLNGLYMANDRQLVDNHTAIDHAMPHCNSHELYKGIIDGKARGVFNGKIFVREDAQKTDAKQTNQTLLLSNDAQINTKPQLEIYADDVKCTHGATVGQLSDEALFYLRSRGIGTDEARSLLTYAFASDVVSRIKVDQVRAQLDHALLTVRGLEGLSE